MIIILKCLGGVSVSLSFRKILNKTQIWQNKGDTIAVFKISLQTYYPSQNQINLAKVPKPIALYLMNQKRAILMVCSELTKLYIHFLC